MTLVAYLLLGFAGLLVALQLWGVVRARRLQGTAAPDFSEVVPSGLDVSRVLLYFYGERCGPCRALAPLVDRLAQRHPSLLKVDVARHPELARRFRIMGTPTFVLVEQGRVTKVHLGGATEQVLTNMVSPVVDKS